MQVITTAKALVALRRPSIEPLHVLSTLVLALLVFAIAYPLSLIVINSFQLSDPGQTSRWGLDNWRLAFDDITLWESLWNTLTVTAARGAIGWPIGILIAWLLARTNIPWRNGLEFLFWISFFMPNLAVTQAWILLLQPDAGLLNQAFAALFPSADRSPFNIYSFWGIVWVHLWGNTIAMKVILLTPGFRHMDASLEEASRVAGASRLITLWRVTLPVTMPALVIATILSVIHAFQAMEIELVLGAPAKLFVFGSKIFSLINHDTPLFGAATVLSLLALGIVLPLIALQRWITGRGKYQTVGGQFKSQPIDLGNWRWVLFVTILIVALGQTLLPFVLLAMGTFMKFYGWFNIPEPWTLKNWKDILTDGMFLPSMLDTLIFATATATLSVIVFSLVAYIIVRTNFFARGIMDYLSWGTAAFPGIVLALGWLWLILGNPFFKPLYGTIYMLVIATSFANITLGVNLMKSNLTQLGDELEEASRIIGASWFYTFRRVVLPLVAPMMAILWVLTFVGASRNISTVALLATVDNQPLAFLQLQYMREMRNEAAAVVGVIVILLSVGVAIGARLFGLRVATHER